MEIAVIGPGAVGTVFGGLLADDGHDVWLVHHREEFVTAIEDRGVRVEHGTDEPTLRVDVPATTDAATVGAVDLAVVLVRTYQTIDAVTEHAACVGPDTRVLSLQNGVTNHHRLQEHLGPDRTLVGVTRQSGSLAAPGHVVRAGSGPTVLGGADGAFTERVAATFRAAGIGTEAVEDPFSHVWRKQALGGAIKPVAALTGRPNGSLLGIDDLPTVMRGLVREASAVASARGFPVDAGAVYEDLRDGVRDSEHRSSMLQDVEAGRRTEIDDCNGAVVAFAAEEGIDVPYNEMATALVRGLERSYLGDE
jgi:2-dehydropantoate 2-reductase